MDTLALKSNKASIAVSDKLNSPTGVGPRITRLGLEIANVSSLIEDISHMNSLQVSQLTEVLASTKEVGNSNKALASAMEQTRSSADQIQKIIRDNADLFTSTLINMVSAMRTLSKGVFIVGEELGKVRSTIDRIQEASDAIQSISRETQLIALNAGVEAARAGDAGRGFAVISKAMRSLADQIRNFANENQNSLAALQGTLRDLDTSARENVSTAETALTSSGLAKKYSQKIQLLTNGVSQITQNIIAMSDPMQRNIEHDALVLQRLNSAFKHAKNVTENLDIAQKRSENILGFSEALMLFLIDSGVEASDNDLIKICQAAAKEVGELFEASVDSGSISLEDLFDDNYSPIPDTNPQQYLTRYTSFTDRALPPIQERIVRDNNRILFALALDRNCYLPTHNRSHSLPQRDDPSWNAIYCRNRRIFDDRSGVRACRSQKPFLWQIYQRRAGDQPVQLIIDIAAPIFVKNRHWGAFRLCFEAQDHP